MSSRQKKKQRRKAAAAARTAPIEPPPSAPDNNLSPSSSTHLPRPPHPTAAPPSPPPPQRHSSGSTANHSPMKQAGSPHLSTPPQSVTEPTSRTSSHTPPPPPSQPVAHPKQIRSYRPDYAGLPADSPRTLPGGKVSTMRQTLRQTSIDDTTAAKYQKVLIHDRATSSPTTSQHTTLQRNYDRQKTATSHHHSLNSNDTMNGSNSSAVRWQTLCLTLSAGQSTANPQPHPPLFTLLSPRLWWGERWTLAC